MTDSIMHFNFMKGIFIFLFFFNTTLSNHLDFSQKDSAWKLVKRDRTISVFKQDGSDGFDKIRIEATINVSLDEFVSVVRNPKTYTSWVYACSSAEKIDLEGDALSYRTVTDLPFPFQDRVLSVKSIQKRSGDSWETDTYYIPTSPKMDQYVEIEKFHSSWKIKQISAEKIRVEYEVETSPGGSIPAWINNMAVDKGPYNTMRSLTDLLEKN